MPKHSEARQEQDRQALLALARRHRSNLAAMARELGEARVDLREKLRRLGIGRDENGNYRATRVETIPDPFDGPIPWRLAKRGLERDFLARQFRLFGGNITRMARALQIDRANLHRKLVGLEIHEPHSRVRRVTGPFPATAPARSGSLGRRAGGGTLSPAE